MADLIFHLEGAIVPKARARVTRHGTFHPHRYQNWKRAAVMDLRIQSRALKTEFPLQRARVSIVLSGKHSRSGDSDNVAGAILDALVQAEILRDDNLMAVPSLALALDWSKKVSPQAEITLST